MPDSPKPKPDPKLKKQRGEKFTARPRATVPSKKGGRLGTPEAVAREKAVKKEKAVARAADGTARYHKANRAIATEAHRRGERDHRGRTNEFDAMKDSGTVPEWRIKRGADPSDPRSFDNWNHQHVQSTFKKHQEIKNERAKQQQNQREGRNEATAKKAVSELKDKARLGLFKGMDQVSGRARQANHRSDRSEAVKKAWVTRKKNGEGRLGSK